LDVTELGIKPRSIDFYLLVAIGKNLIFPFLDTSEILSINNGYDWMCDNCAGVFEFKKKLISCLDVLAQLKHWRQFWEN